MTPGLLAAFLLAVVLLAATPGPAMALVLGQAGRYGFRPAVPTVLGIEVGLFVWALAAGAGLAALVAASELAFWVLRVVGAVILMGLGVRAIRTGLRLRAGADERERPVRTLQATAPGSPQRAFAEALAVQLANPKAAVFMLAFYPQFLPPSGPVLGSTVALALIQVSVESVLYLGLAAAVGRASAWFSRTTVRRRLEFASGSVLVLLGLRMAVTSR